MAVKKGMELEVDIISLAFGGKGIAKPDGFTVFVAQTIPGDRVLARVYKKKKNYAEARLVEVIQPSPDRIEAPCPMSGYCGGCSFQFLAYDKQLEYKRAHVIDALTHIAMLEDVTVHETLPSEKNFCYRNKMEFSISDQRWLLPHELNDETIKRGFGIGLHAPGTFFKILDIDKCFIQPELGNDILSMVRAYIRESELLPYNLKNHTGFWRFLSLRHATVTDQWMVNLVTSTYEPDHIKPLAEKLNETYPNITSIVNNITSRKAGVATGENEFVLVGEDHITESIGPFSFDISANSFFQTNTQGAHQLYEMVKSYAALSGDEIVFDLYCGTGTIGIYVSEMAKKVIGIESVQSAVLDARKNCRKNGIANCEYILGDIKDELSHLSEKPDVMIIDPPRVGMHKDVVKQVIALSPKHIVYVSCNPATLARDVALLKEGYRVVEVQPVDMFPHTYHIESVAKLERKF